MVKVLCIGRRIVHCGVCNIRGDRPASLLYRAIVEAVSQLEAQGTVEQLRRTPKYRNSTRVQIAPRAPGEIRADGVKRRYMIR